MTHDPSETSVVALPQLRLVMDLPAPLGLVTEVLRQALHLDPTARLVDGYPKRIVIELPGLLSDVDVDMSAVLEEMGSVAGWDEHAHRAITRAANHARTAAIELDQARDHLLAEELGGLDSGRLNAARAAVDEILRFLNERERP